MAPARSCRAHRPTKRRSALSGAGPGITALRLIDGRGFPPVAKAYRHGKSAPSCRATQAHSAVMLAAQPAGRRFARVGCAASITAFAPVAPLGCLVSGNGGVPPLPGSQRVGQRRRRAASHGVAPPLRPPASLLHKAAFHKVRCSRCAKAPLGAPHRCAPFGFMKQALCKVASAPSCCVLSSGFWPGASRSTSASGLRPCMGPCPRPPSGPRRFAALARAACPSAPQGGSLSPR